MPRPIKSHLLTSYLATVALALAAPAAHADRPGWLALHTPWRHSLSSRLFTAAPSFGPAVSLPSAPVGNLPQFAAENYSTHTLYVVNSNDNTVSVLNLATCNSRNLSGCARPSPTIDVGQFPLGVAVDEATDTVYVANAVDGTVSVIDGSRCNASDSSGCGQTLDDGGRGGVRQRADRRPGDEHRVRDQQRRVDSGTVSVIDGNSCNGTDQSGCAAQPEAAVSVGDGPSGIGVNPVTNTIYVTNTGFGGPVPDGRHRVGGRRGEVPRRRSQRLHVDRDRSSRPRPASISPSIRRRTRSTSAIPTPTPPATASSRCSMEPRATLGPIRLRVGCAPNRDRRRRPHRLRRRPEQPLGLRHQRERRHRIRHRRHELQCQTIRRLQEPSTDNRGPRLPELARGRSGHTPIYVVDQADNNVAVLNDNSCDAKTTAGCRHPAPTAPRAASRTLRRPTHTSAPSTSATPTPSNPRTRSR